jgi:hypothetical protein
LFFWDCWGDSPKDYTQVDLKHFMKGSVPQGTNLAAGTDSTLVDLKADKSREPTVAIFVIPISAPDEEDEHKTISRMRDNISLLSEHENITPIIVVTHCDLLDEVTFEKEKEKFLKFCMVGEASVFFHYNYSNQKYRDIFIDLNFRKIIDAVYQKGKNKMNVKGDLYYKDVNYSKIRVPWGYKAEVKLDQRIVKILQSRKLTEFETNLGGLGCLNPEDFKDVQEKDLENIGMKKLHAKVLIKEALALIVPANVEESAFQNFLVENKLGDLIKPLSEIGCDSFEMLGEMDDEAFADAKIPTLKKNILVKALASRKK